MRREEALRLGLITEEYLKKTPVMSRKEVEEMLERDKEYIPMVEKMFQDLMDLYEDICY